MDYSLPIPAAPTPENEYQTLGWLQEAITESENFLKAQKGYDRIQPSLDAVMSLSDGNPLTSLSRAASNRIGKIHNDLKAMLTDTKVFWEFKTSNANFDKQMSILGKLSTQWYYNRQIDMRFSGMVGYYNIAGTSYAHQTYDPFIKDISCSEEDPRDVLPLRPAGYESLQSCLGVIVRRERPVNYVKELYPSKAALIVPDRDGGVAPGEDSSSSARALRTLGIDPSPFNKALWGESPKRTMPKLPVVDLYTAYIRDDRINETSHPVQIGQFNRDGEPLNNWSYVVPPGQPLYPNKRMIQFTKTAILYDSTSIYWHGMFPLAKFTLDPQPWSWLGKAPIWDLLTLQTMLDKTLRALDDLMQKAVQPDVIADKQSISRASLTALNTRAAGQKFLQGVMGKGVQIVYPQGPGFDYGLKLRDVILDEMENISGVRDLSQLMRLNQLPGADSIEKLTEAMSPSVRGRSRAMEAFVREFAKMLAFNFAQFYTVPMRLMVMGPDGITPQDMEQYDPGTFIPDFVHPGDYTAQGTITPEALARGPLPRMDRAKSFMEQFTFHVAPGSLLASSEIERKLLYLQLASRGMMDKQTLLEVLGVPNVQQILQRLADEQAQMALLSAGAAGAAAGGLGNPPGRPPSWESMPKLEQKDGGTRSTISTSN